MCDFTQTLTDIEKKCEWLKHCRGCPGKYYCNYESIKKCREFDNPENKN